MGKIRVKLIGDEQAEHKQKEQKKKEKLEKKMAKAPKGKTEGKTSVASVEKKETKTEETDKKKGKKAKFAKAKTKGKKYQANLTLINKTSTYLSKEAIEILKNFKKSKFDETVELHVNVKEKGISGQIDLPHGTGKQRKIKIADDTILSEIEKGKIDFDVLVATPQMMPKLAKFAKTLGPRGLMPNPKAGTISDNPEKLVEKLSGGQVPFKTEGEAPIIHLSIGKISFENKQIEENIKTAIIAIGANKITSATLKSTMSPAIKLNLSPFLKK